MNRQINNGFPGSPDLQPVSTTTTQNYGARTSSNLGDMDRLYQESYFAYNHPHSLTATTTGGGGIGVGASSTGNGAPLVPGFEDREGRSGLMRSQSPPREPPFNTHGVHPAVEGQIPSVKPVVNSHDRLWSEVDVLDDAADLASRVKANGSFFGPAHSKALDQLRHAQVELAQMTAEAEKQQDRAKYRVLWEKSDLESLRTALFDEEHFQQLSLHVDNTARKLDEVAELMKAVDEQSREFWSTLN
ncbi:hypothetical protein AWJ20_822 [Sugiyamaella lignohabitans]|uniref:Uncharacterized protein n=1 Tax=Sugiyamaella lignohabitans TaxID=796027 RepID=A0A167D779_9ASCO|nr:uncharacterized protein AWJ20_822 [Sugiyamaella lignohabitans]ANB12565.1 hypothetical protein AWJ20_822 [Sugiyamaella lignohabitans]